jgi:hypothetical protein
MSGAAGERNLVSDLVSDMVSDMVSDLGDVHAGVSKAEVVLSTTSVDNCSGARATAGGPARTTAGGTNVETLEGIDRGLRGSPLHGRVAL